MAKHRLKQDTGLTRTTRGALVAGAVTVGAVGLPAAPALAQTISVPGFGDINVPDAPAMPQLPPPPEAPTLPQISVPQIPVPQLPQIPTPQLPSAPTVDTAGQGALHAAKSKLGSPYVWGASGPNAFDCSGLVQWAYKQVGVHVPRTSYAQANGGTAVSKSSLRPGDVVIFDGGGHAAMYAGNGQIIEAATTGEPVKFAPLDSMPFYAARRY